MSFHVMSFSWANQHFVIFWKKSDKKKFISKFLSEKTFTFIFFTGLLRAHSVLIMCGYRPWIPSTFVFYPHETIMMEMRTKFSLVSFWESLRKEIDHLREYLKVLLYGKVFLSIFKVSFSKYFHSKVFLSKSIYSLQSEMNFPPRKLLHEKWCWQTYILKQEELSEWMFCLFWMRVIWFYGLWFWFKEANWTGWGVGDFPNTAMTIRLIVKVS